MTSSTIVPLASVEEVLPHPDPETTGLELIRVLGWQLVARKGLYQQSQVVVYVPPGSLLPIELSERLEVTKYLSKQRVRSIKLRGEPSFGLAFTPDHPWEVGTNVADYYGIEKYEPPPQMLGDDGEPEHGLFVRYTDIEHLRTFPTLFGPGEDVVVTEKLDGSNCRIGCFDGEVFCGSFRVQRKRPLAEGKKRSVYWYAYEQMPEIGEMLTDLSRKSRQVILFGEVYGPGIRSLTYGVAPGKMGFRLFDIYCDGRYLDWQEAASWCKAYEVETVPVLAIIPYDLDDIKRLSTGKTTLGNGEHMREGVVVRPLRERKHFKIGRVLLKYINAEYLVKQSDGKVVDYTDQ